MAVSNYVLSNKAKRDLEDIFYYISEELVNADNASKLLKELESKFQEITKFPNAYPVINESRINKENLRKCKVHNYLIIYAVNEVKNRIEIVRVVYQRLDYF